MKRLNASPEEVNQRKRLTRGPDTVKVKEKYWVPPSPEVNKECILAYILDNNSRAARKSIVYTHTCESMLALILENMRFTAIHINLDFSKEEKIEVLQKFVNEKYEVLVCAYKAIEELEIPFVDTVIIHGLTNKDNYLEIKRTKTHEVISLFDICEDDNALSYHKAFELSGLEKYIVAQDDMSACSKWFSVVKRNSEIEVKKLVSLKDSGILLPVDNQLGFGACYAFAATACVSSILARETGMLVALSKQHLIDALKYELSEKGKYSSHHYTCLDFIRDHGISLEKEYEYKHGKVIRNEPLNTDEHSKMKIDGYSKYLEGDQKEEIRTPAEDAYINSILDNQPIACLVDVSESLIYLKKDEIWFGRKKDEKFINFHSALIIGYGVIDKWDVFELECAWGGTWGDNGRGLVRRNTVEHLGIPWGPQFTKGPNFNAKSFVMVPDILLKKAVQKPDGFMEKDRKEHAVKALTRKGKEKLTGGVGVNFQVTSQLESIDCEDPIDENAWLEEAAMLKNDDLDKKSMLMKGLSNFPESIKLWKALIELSDKESAKLLLKCALMSCPLNVEFFIMLARLETYDNAKEVLKNANEPLIWTTTAELEEINSNTAKVCSIIESGIKKLQEAGLKISRKAWMKEAEAAELSGSLAMCKAIINNTIGIGVEEEDSERTWIADAEDFENRGLTETARFIYEHMHNVFLTLENIAVKARDIGKSERFFDSLWCRAQVLWLTKAKEKLVSGDIPAARAILREAYSAIPKSELIWLAAFKIEFENLNFVEAKELLSLARDSEGGRELVWIQSVVVERELGNTDEERRLLEKGQELFPNVYKFCLMKGELDERLGNLKKAKETYRSGLKSFPNCISLWLSLASVEEKMHGLHSSIFVLSMSIQDDPHNPELWLAAVQVKLRLKSKKKAFVALGKALRKCPNSGILWAAYLEMPHRRRIAKQRYDAVGKSNHSPHVLFMMAKLSWHDRKVETARKWFNRAVTRDPKIGDFWGLYYKFELQDGTKGSQESVLNRCIAAEPTHGEKWESISKDFGNSCLSVEAILNKVVELL